MARVKKSRKATGKSISRLSKTSRKRTRNLYRKSQRYENRSLSSAGAGGGTERSYFRPNSSVYRQREQNKRMVHANNKQKRYERYMENKKSVGTYDISPEADEKISKYGSFIPMMSRPKMSLEDM
jgi:hypothetical protein